jgi:hypothetical protein
LPTPFEKGDEYDAAQERGTHISEGTLAVDPTTVAKGKCYQTPSNQHRRVYEVDADSVTYESWGGNVGHTGHLHRQTINRNTFAAAVETEIPCPIGMEPLPE